MNKPEPHNKLWVMKKQIDTLVKLQKIDTETRSIESRLNGVTSKIKALETELEQFKNAVADQESEISELKKKYRDYESEAQLNLSRIKSIEAKLRSVKTNREYQALLKEIEDGKQKNSVIEDQMLECLDRLDLADQAVATKKQEFTALAESINTEKEQIHQKAERDRQKIIELDEEKKEIAVDLEKDLLEKYNIVQAQQPGGLSVVPVKNAVCYGCNMNIPPQMYNELQRQDELKFCPSCQRIIYWDNSES